MNKISIFGVIALTLCGILLFKVGLLDGLGEQVPVIDVDKKSPRDKRVMREITLENGLTALLISDPTLNKSAAAMDVGVGSLANPPEDLGLAHFLEHMLFLGTKKYPDKEEYHRYLASFQGSSNAYTDDEDTNYFFEVNHEGFAGAVDRFAQFFIAPLFTPKYVDDELNAVNSEHQKNLQNDMWRSMMVSRLLIKPDHPLSQFSTGDRETLKSTTHDELIAFHKTYYSANQMKLVMMSIQSLDELEKIARSQFAAVPTNKRDKLKYSSELYAKDGLPRLVLIKPVKDLKQLELTFQTPAPSTLWESKPERILAHLVGYEGAGSLLSLLKGEGLATGLGAVGHSDATSFSGSFRAIVYLTDKGVKEYERVIGLFFDYIRLVKKDFKPFLFDERKLMADVDFIYRDHQEGAGVAASYASRMQLYPALLVDKRTLLLDHFDKKVFADYLTNIEPKKMLAYLMHQGVQTDMVEKYYGANYAIKTFSEGTLKTWENPVQAAELALPLKNPYIPKNFDLASSEKPTEPQKVEDTPMGIFWFQQDDKFFLPKVSARLMILSNLVNASPLDKVLSVLYVSALQDSLNEWRYEIGLAGLNVDVTRMDKGIQIDFSGYSESLVHLITSFSNKLKDITIDEARLNDIKEDLKRATRNADQDPAYRQAIYQMRFLSQKNFIHDRSFYNPDAKLDLVSPVTLEQVKRYADKIYETIAIQGVAYGSSNPQAFKGVIDGYFKVLKAKPLPKADWPQEEVVNLKSAFASLMTGKTNNNAWCQVLQFGPRDMMVNAALRIGSAHLSANFFDKMRTEQQLGYIVQLGVNFTEKSLGLIFLVQSSDYSPFDISARAKAWREKALVELENLTPQQFDAYRKSVITELRLDDKTIDERLDTLKFEAFDMNGQFHYKEQIAKAAEKLTKEQLIAVFKERFNTNAALSVYFSTKPDPRVLPGDTPIANDSEFKKTMGIY